MFYHSLRAICLDRQTFVYSKAHTSKNGKNKVGALNLRYDEFISGAQTQIRRLSASPDCSSTLREHAEYIEFCR